MSNVYSQVRQGEGDYSALRLRLRKTGVVPGGLPRVANIAWQVARTYLGRWRFWIFGSAYVGLTFYRTTFYRAAIERDFVGVEILLSTFLASFVACFVALHVRRQFNSPMANTVPYFAVAHLGVGALASLSVWVIVPLIQAWLLRLPPWGPLGAFAMAGTLLALVACWRQAIVLLLGLPVLIFSGPRIFAEGSPLGDFLLGKEPRLSFAVIATAIVAHLVAAKFLLGESDQSVAISDDFAIETPRQETARGRLDEFMLRTRDGVVRRRLADAGFGWWSVQRWRVPSSASWMQMALAVIIGALFCAAIAWLERHTHAAMLGVVVTSFVMLIAPFHSWHVRRRTIAAETLWPVTRQQYVRQIALAIARDVFAWTVLASFFSLAIMALMVREKDYSPLDDFGLYLLFLWSGAVFAYGLGLATMRSRYWLPLMIGLSLAWMALVVYIVGKLTIHLSRVKGGEDVLVVGAFVAAWILGGLLLARFTLRRWRRADIP
jgi:hypothetical protein